MARSKLPDITFAFKLPPFNAEECASTFGSMTQKLERLVQGVGTNSEMFRIRREQLIRAAYAEKDIVPIMEGLAYIRPLFDLWSKEDVFIERVLPTAHVLGHVNKLLRDTPKKRLGRLAIREACHVFFSRYDLLGNELVSYSAFLRQQLGLYHQSELMFGLDALCQYTDDIVCPSGHIWLAKRAGTTKSPLPYEAEQCGIQRQSSRFYEAALNAHYITRVEALRPGQDDDILYEVRKSEVHSAPYEDNEMLGHPILRLLIDKLTRYGGEPAESWLKTILSIAGDPRIPTGHPNYTAWWSVLGTKRIEQMRRWLSKMDMNLFLDIMKEFSERKGGEDMARMFPKRKRFLQGLFLKDLVEDAQLFLAWQPEQHLRSSVKDTKELPYYQKLTGGDNRLAVFYFKLGNVHLIEGTHSFSLTILDKLPARCPIGTFETRDVFSRSLGVGLEETYGKEFGTTTRCIRIRHTSGWVKTAYEVLRQLGLQISPGDIMDKEDYERMYK